MFGRRLVAVLLVIIIVHAVRTRSVPNSVQWWCLSQRWGAAMCYVCGRLTRPLNEPASLSVVVVYSCSSTTNQLSRRPLDICFVCAEQFGWPLPRKKLDMVVRHWQEIERAYYASESDAPNAVLRMKDLQIRSARILEDAR